MQSARAGYDAPEPNEAEALEAAAVRASVTPSTTMAVRRRRVMVALGAAVAFTSLPAIAQTNQSAAPAVSAKASLTGSHKSEVRRQANMSKEKARTSAHHLRHLKPKTVTP